MPQNNHLVGVWMPGSFVESERKKQGGTEVKRQDREGEAVGKGLQACRTSPREGPASGRDVLLPSHSVVFDSL